MRDPSPDASLEELRETWRSERAPRPDREHTFWGYWVRVADEQGALDATQWDELLSADVELVVTQVLGHLASRDLVPWQLEPRVRARLAGLAGTDARWAEGQVEARAAVRALTSGSEPSECVLDAIVRKGTVWAALEVVPVLSPDALEALRATSEARRVFTKHQRVQLRTAIERELKRRAAATRRGA